MGKLLDISTRMSTAYYSQTDGETEQVNQELETYFRLYCLQNPERWANLIPVLEFTYNNRTHKTTKQTPFYLMGGYEPKPFLLLFKEMNVPSVEQ
jgi:hypothetical protein